MLKVGITGGIGSGKSIICQLFNRLEVPYYSADKEAKDLINHHLPIKKEIEKVFGNEIYNSQGNLDRKKVSELIFKDKVLLEKLNSIVHPQVQQHFKDWLSLNENQKYILKEAAILFESGTYKDLDFIITVIAPVELRINRVIKRDGLTIEQVKSVMKNQTSDEEKIKLSKYIIVNDDQELVIPQVLKIHNEILSKA